MMTETWLLAWGEALGGPGVGTRSAPQPPGPGPVSAFSELRFPCLPSEDPGRVLFHPRRPSGGPGWPCAGRGVSLCCPEVVLRVGSWRQAGTSQPRDRSRLGTRGTLRVSLQGGAFPALLLLRKFLLDLGAQLRGPLLGISGPSAPSLQASRARVSMPCPRSH